MQAKLLENARSIQFAFDQFDEANCRGHVITFQKLSTQVTRTYGTSAIPRKRPRSLNLEWNSWCLDAENVRLASRASAVAKLESVMDRSDATVAQIESAYQKRYHLTNPLAAELFNRYRSTITDMQMRGRRRFQLAVGSANSGSLLARPCFSLAVSTQPCKSSRRSCRPIEPIARCRKAGVKSKSF